MCGRGQHPSGADAPPPPRGWVSMEGTAVPGCWAVTLALLAFTDAGSAGPAARST